jgi:hypothetical protein
MTRGRDVPREGCAREDPRRRKAEGLLVGLAEAGVDGKESADVAQQVEGHGRIHLDEARRLRAPRGEAGSRWLTQVSRVLTVSPLRCQDTPRPPAQRGRSRSGSDEPQMSGSREGRQLAHQDGSCD